MKVCSVKSKTRSECCGCSVCQDVCPKSAIEMQTDLEGFEYPFVDEKKCIDCGLCIKTCPTEINNLKNTNAILKTVCGRYKDVEKLKNVSSGGLCNAVAENFINAGGVVYGAGYTDDFHQVKIVRISEIEDLIKIRGSKYVQTLKHDGIYKILKSDLKDGKSVLFIGLPCEVAGVRQFIGEHNKLYCIEIICSGVPSPQIHSQFSEYIEEITHSKITSFNYRKKQHGWHWPYVEIKSENQVVYNKSWSTMALGYAFHALVRPSCHNCKFKGEYNKADITAGDFWGLKKTDQRYNRNGVSAIIIRTEKGVGLIDKLNEFELYEATYAEIIAGNPRLHDCPIENGKYKKFRHDFVKFGLIKAYRSNLTIKDFFKNCVMTIYSILNFR